DLVLGLGGLVLDGRRHVRRRLLLQGLEVLLGLVHRVAVIGPLRGHLLALVVLLVLGGLARRLGRRRLPGVLFLGLGAVVDGRVELLLRVVLGRVVGVLAVFDLLREVFLLLLDEVGELVLT